MPNGLDHNPIDILELQITVSTLQNEALMRYVHVPKNLQAIRDILKKAFDDLGNLPADEAAQCPVGWNHVMSRCITPTMSDQCYMEGHQASK